MLVYTPRIIIIIKTYMLSLLFMVLHLRQCIKPDSTRAADEVLQACHDMVNTLKMNGNCEVKKKLLEGARAPCFNY